MKHTTNKKKKAPAQRHSAPVEETPALWATHLLKALLITLGIGLGLILLGALILYFTSDPNAYIKPLGLVLSALIALSCGFVTVKLHGHAALLCGLFGGSTMMAVMLLLSLFFKTFATGYSAGIACLLHAGFLLLSVAGAYLGLGKTKHRTKR